MIDHFFKTNRAEFKTASDAWKYATWLINSHGENILDENNQMTREIMNLHLCILEPLAGFPIANSGWDLPALDRYAEQLLSGENPSGFKYVYGERLRTYPDTEGNYTIDQIDLCIGNLKRSPNSRRSVAITWVPDWDGFRKEVPCLQILDFLIRGSKLNCTAFFRSHDIGRAWCPNVYGLARLMAYIGKEVGVPVGSLTTISCSAHQYEV